MRIFLAALIAVLLGLNYLLWMSEDKGLRQVRTLETAVQKQKDDNARMLDRNRALDAEVKDLKGGLAALEERARTDLGMVRKDETFFRLLDEAPTVPPNRGLRPGEMQKPATAAGAGVSVKPTRPQAPRPSPPKPPTAKLPTPTPKPPRESGPGVVVEPD